RYRHVFISCCLQPITSQVEKAFSEGYRDNPELWSEELIYAMDSYCQQTLACGNLGQSSGGKRVSYTSDTFPRRPR
ncbi:uncharacterized protein METZ01_LOCUS99484, partial [marine metagenome]